MSKLTFFVLILLINHMATSKVIYLGDLRTRAVHLRSGETYITDAPVDNQGKGEAFSPTDLCATSLANCGLTIMGIAARNHDIDITETLVEVTKFMADKPRRISRIEIRYHMPEYNYTIAQKKILEAAARQCPVALSLHPDLEQDIQFIWKEE